MNIMAVKKQEKQIRRTKNLAKKNSVKKESNVYKLTWKLLKFMIRVDHKKILGINMRNIHYVYPSKNRKFFSLADEKMTAKEMFSKAGVPSPETIAVFRNYEDLFFLKEKIQNLQYSAVKPNRGSGGHGILILDKYTENGIYDVEGNLLSFQKIRRHISDILMGVYSGGKGDEVMVEKRLYPSKFLKKIYHQGLADFRILCNKKKPVMGMLRVPTKISHGKANLHQGGIGIGIDLKRHITTWAIFKGKYIEKHPDSGVRLAGMKVPKLNQMIDYSIRVCEHIPLQYIGFDFTIDQIQGPVLLEMNVRPGLEIQKVNKCGLLEVLES